MMIIQLTFLQYLLHAGHYEVLCEDFYLLVMLTTNFCNGYCVSHASCPQEAHSPRRETVALWQMLKELYKENICTLAATAALA